MSNVKTFSKRKDGEKKLSENFKVKEFACHDGTDKILIDMDMIPILQKIRDLGGVVKIDSAYRTEAYNLYVGGASKSYHCKGQAFDIVCKGLDLFNLCNLAKALGLKGIIKYGTFVHIDSRTSLYHYNNVTKKYLSFEKYNVPFVETLKTGSKGTNVGIVQFKLNSLGYNCGNADGAFGKNTDLAVKAFQKANSLSADGIVGSKTWNKLFN